MRTTRSYYVFVMHQTSMCASSNTGLAAHMRPPLRHLRPSAHTYEQLAQPLFCMPPAARELCKQRRPIVKLVGRADAPLICIPSLIRTSKLSKAT